jgi:hypothetical protein
MKTPEEIAAEIAPGSPNVTVLKPPPKANGHPTADQGDSGPTLSGIDEDVLDLARYELEDPKPPAFVIADLVPKHAVTGLFGQDGLGKSLLGQHLLSARVLGTDFFGHRVIECTRTGWPGCAPAPRRRRSGDGGARRRQWKWLKRFVINSTYERVLPGYLQSRRGAPGGSPVTGAARGTLTWPPWPCPGLPVRAYRDLARLLPTSGYCAAIVPARDRFLRGDDCVVLDPSFPHARDEPDPA